jgi:hypothetical protein
MSSSSFLLFIPLLTLISSCGVQITGSELVGSSPTLPTLSGSVVPLSGLISKNNTSWYEAYAAPCTDPVYARLYGLTSTGTLNDVIATQELEADAKFSFNASLISFDQNVNYVVEVSGCNGVFYRPVTGINSEQDVTLSSTLVGLVTQTNTNNYLQDINASQIEELIGQLSGSSLSNIYQAIDTETSLSSQFFAMFGSHHSVLALAMPQLLEVQIPQAISEGLLAQFRVNAAHFHPSYNIVYRWKLDGVLKSSTNTFNYTPGKNEQGIKTLSLYIGKDDGLGEIDVTKPYYYKSYLVTVANTMAPTAPAMSLASGTTTLRNITIDINTGFANVNCDSFTSLALTEETTVVPSSTEFTISCTSPVSQALNYTLISQGSGLKTLRLWAKDASGNISATPTVATVTYDSAPILTVTTESSTNGAAIEFTVDDCTDRAHVLVNTGTRPLTSDGSWVACSTVANYSHNFSGSDGIKTYKVWSKDSSGNVSDTSTSISATWDTSAPTLILLDLAGGAASVATPFIEVNMAASDVHSMSFRISEDSSFTGASWQTYSTSFYFNLSSMPGSKTVYFEIKDSLGNTTAVTRSIYVELGVAPVVKATSPAAGFYYENDSFNLGWECNTSSGNLASIPINKVEYTINDGLSFVDITSQILLAKRSNAVDSFSWTIPPALDNVPFRIQLSCESEAGVVSKILSRFYNTTGWGLYAGAPWNGLKDIAALNANLTAPNYASSMTVDRKNNVYYVKGHAVMKLSNQTSYVSLYLGATSAADTALITDGTIASSMRLYNPKLIGTSSDFRYIFLKSLLTTSSIRIYRIDTDTDSIELWNTIADPMEGPHFVTKNRWLLFTSYFSPNWYAKIKRLNLNTKNASLETIAGKDGSCGTMASNGSDALGNPLPMAYNSYCYYAGSAYSLYANADATKIWLSTYVTHGFRLDWDSTNSKYIIGNNNFTQLMGENCAMQESDGMVFCSMVSSRNICGVNPETGAHLGCKAFSFPGNDNSGWPYISTASSDIYIYYNLNSIMRLNWANSTFTTIAGQPFSVFGNGIDLSLVAFHDPTDMKYSSVSNMLMIRNTSGHMRIIDYNTNPRTISTSFYSNYAGPGIFSLSYDGTKFSNHWIHGACAGLVFDRFTFNPATKAIGGSLGNLGYMGSCNSTNTYPIPDNTANNQALILNTFRSLGQLAHSNGNFYASFQNTNGHNTLIYKSNLTTMNILAGRLGAGGHDPLDHTNLATGALLTNANHFQELSDGDMVFWDNHRMRKITITTESAAPKIYDVFDYRTVAGYSTATSIDHAILDESTGNTYLIKGASVYKVTAAGAIGQYTFTGITVYTGNRLALTPDGLLILEKTSGRILKVDP